MFRTRCFNAQEKCAVEVLLIREVAPGHQIACHFPIQVADLPKRIEVESVPANPDATTLVGATTGQSVGVGTPHA